MSESEAVTLTIDDLRALLELVAAAGRDEWGHHTDWALALARSLDLGLEPPPPSAPPAPDPGLVSEGRP